MVRVEDIDVDVIWRSLGPWGKYQLKQVSSYLFICVSWVIHQLSIVFIGFRPHFQCKPLNDSTTDDVYVNGTIRREYGECKIKTFVNTSLGEETISETNCLNGWDYDIPKEQSFVTEWDFVCENAELAELTQMLLIIGMMLGTFILPTASDRFGRKPVLVISHILLFGTVMGTSFTVISISVVKNRYGRKPVMVISHILLFGTVMGTSFSPNYTVFVILRILTGMVSQGALSGTTLALESFPTEIRCYEEIMALFMWTTAICVMSPIAFALRNVSWRYLQITYGLMSAWSVFQWWMLDESLRWVIANGQIERAKRIIKNACRWNKKDYKTVIKESGLDDIMLETGDQLITKSDKSAEVTSRPETEVVAKADASLIDIVRHPEVRKVSMIMWFLWITDSLVYYGLFMISSDLYGDRYINFLLSGLLEYPACAFEAYGLNRLGRKWTSMICHFVAAIGLVLATGLIYGADGDTHMLAAGTAFTLLGKMAITGAFSSAYLLTPELYPTNMRNSGLGASSFMGKVGGMIAPFFRNVGEKIPWMPGFVFAIMCIITVVLLAFVPETNGIELPQSLDELTEWYKVNGFSFSIGKNAAAEKLEKKLREIHDVTVSDGDDVNVNDVKVVAKVENEKNGGIDEKKENV